MISTTFTFYGPGQLEHNWYGEKLPAAPEIGSTIHPGDALGPEFERCWEVKHVRWVHDDTCGWALEIGLA